MIIPKIGREPEDDPPDSPMVMYNDIVLIRDVRRIHCKRVCMVPLTYIIIKAVTINFDWSRTWYAEPDSPPMLSISSQSPNAYTTPITVNTCSARLLDQMLFHCSIPPSKNVTICMEKIVNTFKTMIVEIEEYRILRLSSTAGSYVFEASMMVGWMARESTKNTNNAI